MDPAYESLSAWSEWAFEVWCEENGYKDVADGESSPERYQEAREKWKAGANK